VKHLPVDDVRRVYRFALRLAGDPHEAEDIAQEAFLRAWRARRDLREQSSARTWLFRIAVNVWRDRLRRARLPAAQTQPLADDEPSHPRSPDRIAAERDAVSQAIRAMDELPPRQRQVLYLYSLEGLAIAEVADVLQISPDAAKASLSLARQTLRRKLGDLEAPH